MKAIEDIRNHPLYVEAYKKLEQEEQERIFCCHQMEHLLDELSCAQALVLKITEMTVEATGEPEANADEGEGSVFAESDLTAAKGEKPKAGEGEE